GTSYFQKRKRNSQKISEFEGLYIVKQPGYDEIKAHWDKLVLSTQSFPESYWDKFVKKKVSFIFTNLSYFIT
ncbi:ryanodine receptor 44F, partial [Biomphalaria pfeifferi]